MLTNEEDQARKKRRELIVTLIELYPKASDRDISQMVLDRGFRSCSHTLVNTIRHEIERKKWG